MKSLKVTNACLLILFLCSSAFAQPNLTWYPFDTDFINAHFTDSGMGELKANRATAAGNVHTESCGGNDAELHIGIKLADLALPSGQMPLTGPIVPGDNGWGIVAELPNAALADGPDQFDLLQNKAVTFTGYFRVWDEGHSVGAVHPSNPHHVFEVHPAWSFSGEGANFMRPDMIAAMQDYRGYGATKFKPLLKAVSDEKWPLAYQGGGKLFLGLAKDQNFYQLPVKVKAKRSVNGGHEWTLDVYSDKKISKLVYKGLTAVTTTGAPIDTLLSVGQKTFLLGFFSVNLKKAMDGSSDAASEADAIAIGDSLEFYVFGVAVNSAVATCSH
jgi:hypothetical protein